MEDVIVRHIESRDIPGVRDIYKGETAVSGTLMVPHPSLADWEKRLSNPPAGVYILVAEKQGEIVGHGALMHQQNPRRHHVGAFMMAVKDEHHGLGVGSQLLEEILNLADNWLNLRRVEMNVFTDNEPAIHLYKKFGFIVEGESPDYAFRKGEYIGVYHMGRIKQP
ncbi:MAG: GNAT family N-acetyltransferase [Endozoicomonas sp.]|uniref:GNAT family N-acetyltransferase n=1 Tax=Endozoicomonas sp. TaxID=1892382 RepID=UPI003D9ABD9E